MNSLATTRARTLTRRRSQRVILSIPVTVTGRLHRANSAKIPQTLVINAHGALIVPAAKIAQGQQVAGQEPRAPRSSKPAAWFTWVPRSMEKPSSVWSLPQPAPNFWHIAFPPEDWAPPEDPPPERKGSKT